MRWLLLTASLVATLTVVSSVGAQEREDEGRPSVTVEVHTERPPEGSLRRGYLAAPGWVLYLGGGILVLGAAGGLALRFRRSGRGVGERRP